MRLFLILLFSFSLAHAAPPLSIGGTASDWTLKTGEAESLNYYEDSENKVSVILFWATWCPYCRSLMPHIEVMHRKYRNKGVKFYFVDIYEEGKIDPILYFNDRGFSAALLLNGDDVAKQYGVKGTPAVYVIDKNKKVVYKRPAGVTDIIVKQNVDLRIRQALKK
jgi:thiol-disulfide isomerase/thioredoxin